MPGTHRSSRRSYLRGLVGAIGLPATPERVLTETDQEGERPHGWDELHPTDRRNIRRYLQHRPRQNTDHEASVLVGVATTTTDGPLSTARLSDFTGPVTRPERPLACFLVFVGAETPACPKCGERDYRPAIEHPEQMRCQHCTFRFTLRELSYMI